MMPVQPIYDNLEALIEWASKPETHSTNDREMGAAFLLCYKGSEATFNAYRREIERFIQWQEIIQKKTLKAMERQDIEAFIDFCCSPPVEWIGLQMYSRFINLGGFRQPNEHWRPFVIRAGKHQNTQIKPADYVLSQSAQESIFRILSTFFTFLENEDYVFQNPVKRIRQKNRYIRRTQSQAMVRRLSELQWDYVIETAEIMADAEQHHERTLFIMTALYSMYLRISELTASDRWTPRMSHFFCDQDGHWWFKTVGKGNKERDITVSHSMKKALSRYRESLSLPPLPIPSDQKPLLPKQRGQGGITSTRHLRRIVQDCFDRSMARLQHDGFKDEALQLSAATVHWLRHTGISDDVKIRPREHVRDDAGHTSSAITDKYIDIDRRERHASAINKSL